MTKDHPEHSPPAAIDASTVLVLRELAQRLEVLCVRRHPKLSAWGGAVAFPGGKVEPEDALPDTSGLDSEPLPRCRDFGDDADAQRGFTVAAARECFEEVCVLPIVGGGVGHEAAAALRESLGRGRLFRQVLVEHRLGVDLGVFVPLAHWITPPHLPRRFDARFYVLRLPDGQTGASDGAETTSAFWTEPKEILFQFERGDVELAAPTLWMLDMLSTKRTVDHAIDFANRQSLQSIQPEIVLRGGDVVLAMPGFPGHSVSRPRLDGPRSFVLRVNRFVINRET
jgi:8-oxo-dGTP pyrophosphatase MutT (NUDIX family)